MIFDCDGVLFESAGANIAFYNAVLERLGRPPLDEAWARRAHFLSSHQLYDAMFGAGTPEAADALRVGRDARLRAVLPADAADAGSRARPAALSAHYRLAMATNRGGTAAGVVREFALDRWLTLTVGANDVARAKPHPDMLLRCLEHFRVPPTAAAYVGDSETDHQAALAAGVPFIGFGPAAPATHRVHALRELPALLETMTRRRALTRVKASRQKAKGKNQGKSPEGAGNFCLLPFDFCLLPCRLLPEHDHPAVDRDALTGDHLRVVRGQPHRGAGEVVRIERLLDGHHHVDDHLEDVGGHALLGRVGERRAGGDGVDADAADADRSRP